jgi:hypothetical protein
VPNSRRCTPGLAAIFAALAKPCAVSICGSRNLPCFSAIPSRASSMRSVLDRMMPAMPAAPQTARSSRYHSVVSALMRSRTLRPGASHCRTAALACALFAGGTASSRSMITASAPLAQALSKRSGRSPGTNR